MVQIHISDVDGLQKSSIWKTDPKLKILSRIERNLISAFPWMVGLVLFGIAAYSPSTDIWRASITASAMLVLAPFLYLMRVFINLIIHLTLIICSLCAIYIASQTGGVMSVQLAWLLFAFFCGFNVLEATQPSLVSRIAPAASRGAAMGVYNTLQSLGFFAGGVMGGQLVKSYGTQGLFLTCAALLLLWLVVAWPMVAPKRAAPSAKTS